MSSDESFGGGGTPNLSADECVRAGMYWFGRSDLAAAEAWWRRALYLDPTHARAQECLRLLARATEGGVSAADTGSLPRQGTGDLARDSRREPTSPEVSGPSLGRPAHIGIVEPPPLLDEDVPSLEAFANSVLDPETPIGSRAYQEHRVEAHRPEKFEISNAWATDVLTEGSPPVIEVPPLFTPVVPAPLDPAPAVAPRGRAPSDRRDQAKDRAAESRGPRGGPSFPSPSSRAADPNDQTLRTGERVWEPPLDIDAAAWALGQAASSTPDPFEFAMDGVQREVLEAEQQRKLAPAQKPDRTRAPPASATPWDEGPSRTSVVTLGNDGEPDAIAEATPRPDIETDRFFGRFDPEIIGTLESAEELSAAAWEARADALRAEALASSGSPGTVAPAPPPPPLSSGPEAGFGGFGAGGGEITFDEPVELPPGAEAGQAQSPEDLLQQAKDQFQLHDFAGALEILEDIATGERAMPEARALLAEARVNLMRMYESKIGGFEQVPRLLISSEELIWLNLNHRAGFILSQIDGSVTYEDIVSLSGMPRLDTLKILAALIQDKVIGAD